MRVQLPRHSAVRLGAATSVLALTIAGLTASTSVASPDGTAGFTKAAAQPALVGSVTADKSPSSGLAKTPPGLRNLATAKRIPVMVKYDYDALASYTGTVRGYSATSPSVTKKALRLNTAAKTRYLGYVKSRESSISGRIRTAVPSARITQSYRIVYGGVAATVPGNSIGRILRLPGVVAVQRDSLNQPLTDSSGAFINAGAAYHSLHTTRNAGQGILLGNLDTGVWPEHPSFADQGNLPAYSGPALPCNFGDNPLTPANDPFVCGNKLVGGDAFLDTYDANNAPPEYDGTARDAEGHGSHTASTSAGNLVHNVQTIGPLLSQINGMAPGAQVMEYRVCGPAGCYSSDSAQAVEQAILDGVKVINFSISGGTSPMTDPVELAFLDAYNAGVFVSASAGNSGPTAGTANHLSPWVTSVAASTQSREFASTLTLTASDSSTFQVEGASIMPGAGPLPVVLASAAPYSDAICNHVAPAGTFTGKIVVCARGANARVEKGYNVMQGGAAGMILYNPVLADVETDNHWLPAVHVADGTAMLAFINGHTGITGSFTAGAAKQGQGDVMAAFSSRGPAGLFVKPDITAPGIQILAAMTPTPDAITSGPAGEYYQAIAGTSMSSPHIAGAALLIAAVHPSWTPGQIKSAIMTQAKTTVVKEDLSTPADPFDMGAGRIDVGRAISAPLTISDSAANFAALTADPLHAIDLNIPSINAPTMPGRVTTTRTVQNVTNGQLRVSTGATVPANTHITFSPKAMTIPAGGSGSFSITIDSTAPVGSQQFATVRFISPKGTAHLPVAFVHKQGAVTLDQTCADPSLQLTRTTTCTVSATNTGFDSQDVDLTTSVNKFLKVVSATGATVSDGKAHTSATLAGASLGVPSVDPGSSPAGGYLDLGLFGIAPTPIGDEQILNFNTPSFVYNGQPASRIGIDSNGYLVVGGGTSADNECCNLPSGASPNPPNNILAPFWTDLDGTGANGITVATLTDGVNTWLVVQWEVNVFGTTDLRSFQTWIGIDGVQDISYTYLAAQTDPGQPFLVGAENANGDGDVSAFLPSADLVVTSTDPAPGDTVSYTVTVGGVQRGPGNVHTDMDATGVSGTTTADTPITVTR
jgi:hypothetical protein